MNDVCVADINMDTFPDLIGACSNRQFYVALSLGARDCNASYPVVTGAIRDMNSVDAVDVDKDGDFDLVGASNDGKMYICINLGNMQGFHPGDFSTQPGSISKITLESGANSLRESVVRDINGDEWPDIIALGSSNSGQVYVIINDGFGTYPDTNIYRMFSAGQTSKSIAAAPLVRAGFVDLLVDNGDRMDVWQNGAGPFSEVVSGPALVSALQGAVDNATAVLDEYGNPMVTVRLSLSNLYTGLLHFDDLAINCTYNALVDFTKPLSDLLNVTNRTGEEMLSIPVVFKMDSAGVLKISNLSIDPQIRLVAFIDSPADGSGLYLNRSYTLQGHSNYDLDGELFNYSWTDLSSGRLLGYGGQCRFTPSARGDLTIQLKVRSDIGKLDAVATARLTVVDGPAAALDIAKMTMKPREPGEGDIVTLSVTVRNTGNLNATNVGFQVFLDGTGGLPVASGVLDRVDAGRTATATAVWQAGRPGSHRVIIRITQSDVPFTTSVQPFQTSVNVRRAQPGYPVELIAYGTFIGLGAAAAAAFFLTTEIGKYLGLSLFLPLYSKLQPEEVLDRFIRGKILGYIRANPGAHYNLIKQDLDLHNGTLVHHLDTLERNGFIRSARDGTLKRFFPGNGKLPEGKFYLSPIQDSITKYIGANPGVSQADLSRGLYIEPHIVRYHVKVLRDADVLRVEEEGNRTKLFLK
jgi:DNA-binding MarR family transcriptional regulator